MDADMKDVIRTEDEAEDGKSDFDDLII